jgi:hypothetical protein
MPEDLHYAPHDAFLRGNARLPDTVDKAPGTATAP